MCTHVMFLHLKHENILLYVHIYTHIQAIGKISAYTVPNTCKNPF